MANNDTEHIGNSILNYKLLYLRSIRHKEFDSLCAPPSIRDQGLKWVHHEPLAVPWANSYARKRFVPGKRKGFKEIKQIVTQTNRHRPIRPISPLPLRQHQYYSRDSLPYKMGRAKISPGRRCKANSQVHSRRSRSKTGFPARNYIRPREMVTADRRR